MTSSLPGASPDPLTQLKEDARRLRPLCAALCCLYSMQNLARHRGAVADMDAELARLRAEGDAAWARLELIDAPGVPHAASYIDLGNNGV